MDTLTHGLSGVLLARVMKVKNVKPKAFVVVGFLSGIFPDFDFLFNAISPTTYLLNHRGITHSFFLLPIWAFLISIFCAWLFKNKIFFKNNWVNESADIRQLTQEFGLLAMGAIFLHIIGDIVTQFGTMFLSPFSNQRFEIGSVFIIDLWFSGILIAGILLSYLKHRRFIAGIFFMLWFTYIGYTYYMKNQAEEVAKKYLISQSVNLSDVTIFSSPRPVSPNNWSIAAYDKNSENYYLSDFSLNPDKIINHDYRNQSYLELINNSYPSFKLAHWNKLPKWGRTPEEKNLSHQAWNDDLFAHYRWFYAIPVFDFMTKDENKTCGYFRDLRFLGVGREAGTPFVYGICYQGNQKYLALFKNGQE